MISLIKTYVLNLILVASVCQFTAKTQAQEVGYMGIEPEQNDNLKLKANPTAFLKTKKEDLGEMQARVGGGSDGGSFTYYYTSSSYLRHIKAFIQEAIESLPDSELKYLEEKYKVNINWKEFAKIVGGTKGAPLKNVIRKNPDGHPDVLIMDYDKVSGEITALEPFFKTFNKENLSIKETYLLMSLLIHEASHIFGLGINNDDGASKKFSIELTKHLSNYSYRCLNGNGQSALQRCALALDDQSQQAVKFIWIKIFAVKGSEKIPLERCFSAVHHWTAKNPVSEENSFTFVKEIRSSDPFVFNIGEKVKPYDRMVLQVECYSNPINFKDYELQFSIETDSGMKILSPTNWSVSSNTVLFSADLSIAPGLKIGVTNHKAIQK